ncbi:MAG: outer membrane beta-barrel protein [Bacteroidota bacterium]
MNDWKSIDQRIAQKLNDYSEAPPSGGWERVRDRMDAGSEGAGASSGHWFSMTFLWRAAAIAILVGISVFFFLPERSAPNSRFMPRQEVFADEKYQPESLENSQANDGRSIENPQQQKRDNGQNQANPSHLSSNSNPSSGVISSQTQESDTTVKTKQITKPINPKQITPNKVAQKNESQTNKHKTLENRDMATSVAQTTTQQKTGAHNNEVLEDEVEPEQLDKNQSAADNNLNDTTKEIALHKELPIPDRQGQTKQEFIRPGPYSVGFLVNAHQIYNTADALEGRNAAYGIGLSGRYHFSEQYFIESGLGLEQSKDGWDYIVDYRKKELIGYYQDVDSVSYQIVTGSTGQDSVILQYHTHQQAVYDTVDGTMNDVFTQQYTYFTIPLMLGYQNSFKRFRYSVSTGLLMALTIHEKSNALDIDQSGLEVVETRNEVYHRVKTHWQYVLNLGLGYRFHHQWYFAIEPALRVSVQDLYQNSGEISSKKPYSVGIRTGVFYRF